MKTIQLDLFYEKGNGYYKYWYRIYAFMRNSDNRDSRRVSEPQT